EKSKNASHLCHLKRSDLHMSYAGCRMQKVKSAGLKGMQFHNQRERESRTNEDIDRERTHENYDLQNDENINYNERVKDIIDSQKTGTRKTRKDAVLVNELLVTSDRDFLSDWIQENKNDFLRKVINYFLNDTASKILLTQQSIMMSKPLTCI